MCVCVCWVLHIHKSSIFPSKAHSYVIVKIYIQNPAVNKSKHVGFCVKIDITVKQCVCSGSKMNHSPDYNSRMPLLYITAE